MVHSIPAFIQATSTSVTTLQPSHICLASYHVLCTSVIPPIVDDGDNFRELWFPVFFLYFISMH
jgi:hypothetical protein